MAHLIFVCKYRKKLLNIYGSRQRSYSHTLSAYKINIRTSDIVKTNIKV